MTEERQTFLLKVILIVLIAINVWVFIRMQESGNGQDGTLSGTGNSAPLKDSVAASDSLSGEQEKGRPAPDFGALRAKGEVTVLFELRSCADIAPEVGIVKKNEKFSFVNRDSVSHTLVFVGQGEKKTELKIDPGKEGEMKLADVGVYIYQCDENPNAGTLFVE